MEPRKGRSEATDTGEFNLLKTTIGKNRILRKGLGRLTTPKETGNS